MKLITSANGYYIVEDNKETNNIEIVFKGTVKKKVEISTCNVELINETTLDVLMQSFISQD